MKVSPSWTGWYPPSTYSDGSSRYSSSALSSFTALTSVNDGGCSKTAIAGWFSPKIPANWEFSASVFCESISLSVWGFVFMWKCALSKRLTRSYTSSQVYIPQRFAHVCQGKPLYWTVHGQVQTTCPWTLRFPTPHPPQFHKTWILRYKCI